MRIVGDIAHPQMKITIFKNDGKFSLKCESGLLEQLYKFRDDDRLATVEDVKKMVDASFIHKMEEILRGMYDAKIGAMQRNLARPEEEEFETII